MTKKTKKKKIISDYRRRLQILEAREHRNEIRLDTEAPKQRVAERTPSEPAEKSNERALSSFEREQLDENARYIAKDLKRTLFLSVIGIAVIFGLYFFAPL